MLHHLHLGHEIGGRDQFRRRIAPGQHDMGFAVSGALAGAAGGLFAYVQSVISPDSFNVHASLLLLTMAVLGGLGNLTGAAAAGFLLTIVPELFRPFAEWRMIVYGVFLLMVLRMRPHGLLGAR